MSEYTPDKWLIVDLGDHFRVFSTWSGGYLDGDSWRLNSGIASFEEEGDYVLFKGHSGSITRCRKTSYGTTGYGMSVISSRKLKTVSSYKKFKEMYASNSE